MGCGPYPPCNESTVKQLFMQLLCRLVVGLSKPFDVHLHEITSFLTRSCTYLFQRECGKGSKDLKVWELCQRHGYGELGPSLHSLQAPTPGNFCGVQRPTEAFCVALLQIQDPWLLEMMHRKLGVAWQIAACSVSHSSASVNLVSWRPSSPASASMEVWR